MKLEKILDSLNSFEKNSFLKILDNIISNNPKNFKEIDKILSDYNKELKNIDNINISKVFELIESEFTEFVKAEFLNTTSQIDILVDILIRDGNCIMKRDWLASLYAKELKDLQSKTLQLKKEIDNEKSDIDSNRIRDYEIYKACVHTAYFNDKESNREYRITDDEQSILLTLANKLELSQEEIKLINYLIIPPQKMEIDDVINDLKNIGIIFYSKKNNQIQVADEVVRILRKIREKELADKFLRRFLKLLKDSEINLICKKHNIDKKLGLEEKIRQITKEGISFRNLLLNEIYKEDTKLNDKKKYLNEIWEKGFKVSTPLKGTTLEEKIENILIYFENIEKDEKVGISVDGYEKLLSDLNKNLPKFNQLIKQVFEFQEENVLISQFLLDYNIKPIDILDLIESNELEIFCKNNSIKIRGNTVLNVLEAYKDSENIYLENYENIGYRNMNLLRDNGILLKEVELGLKFEELTGLIFKQLGFNVDEKLKKDLNTKKDKMDLVLNLDNNDIIIIECKSVKESGYNKFSSVSRQLKSYINLAQNKGYNVIKSLLIAPEFSDDFVNECGLEFEINLSLITASSLLKILDGFKNSKKHKHLPYQLLLKDVLIKEDRILKAINK